MKPYWLELENVEAERPLKCRHCQNISRAGKWADTKVGCEDCGDHPAIQCPICEEVYDLVYIDFEDFAS